MSQNARILAHLKTGAPITQAEAGKRFKCGRLAARIYDLRAMGHVITTERPKGTATSYARYHYVGWEP